MKISRRVTIATAALLAALSGCGDGNNGADGSGASAGAGGSGGTPSLPEFGSFDRANVSYADNLLQKVQDGDWTLGQGLVATLQAFAGERDESEVLRYPSLTTYEGTGVFMMARRYLEDGPDAEARTEIVRLLRLLAFSIAELEQMAGIGASIEAPLTTKGGAAPELCSLFFEGFENPPQGVSVCLEVESITIGENEHRIFFPADPLPTAGWDQTSITMAVDALADSIPVYDAIGDVPAISIVYSVTNSEKLWGQSFPTGSGECAIAIYTGLQTEPQDRFQQLLAHEIAHCFQGETWPAQHGIQYDVIKWHFEGAAEYWSNLVYPEVNLEWGNLPDLERWELVSYLHNRSYENFIFFQYLGSTLGNDAIAAVISGLPDTPGTGVVEQREGLADYANMEQVFHDFTQALTDGAVQDTSGALIPYTAPAYEVELFGPQDGVISVPLLFPFATYRFLISTDEDEQATLSFEESGTITTSARHSTEGVAAGESGVVNESLFVPGLKPWSPSLPPELPEEECDSAARMLLATTTASPSQGSDGNPSGASFELDVTDMDNISCCLHGQWLMNNQDLAAADTEGLGLTTTYSGQLTADYRSDGTVLFLWGGVTRTIQGTEGATTATINGGGAQFYEVPSPGFLIYGPPEITVSVDETAASGQTASFNAVLETGLGDFPSQPFECNDDSLVTIIRGNDQIGWTRIASE